MYRKSRKHYLALMIIIIGLSISLIALLISGCRPYQDPSKTPENSTTDKGNPKLDSQLNKLIAALAKGQATAIAQSMNIPLNNGSVRVIIECQAGQLESGKQAALNAGATVETYYNNSIQALVPITSLTNLSMSTSVQAIHLPMLPLPMSQ